MSLHINLHRKPISKYGFFLDDERSPAIVPWCCSRSWIVWTRARDFDHAISKIEWLISQKIQLSAMSLDWYLGYELANRCITGDTFLIWFISTVKTMYEEKGIMFLTQDFELKVHSHAHPMVLNEMKERAHEFLKWNHVTWKTIISTEQPKANATPT